MNIHEELFVKNFIVPRKVEELMTLVPPNQQFSEGVHEILKSKGAPAKCYIIANYSDMDGKEMPRMEALTQTVGHGGGTFVSCIAGKLGYFESDEATDRYILEKK